MECEKCTFKANGSCDSEQDWINCCLLGNHPYSEIECECGEVFCWDCAGENGENPYNGGSYRSCPKCGVTIWDRPEDKEG